MKAAAVITDEIRAQIVAEPETVSYQAIAEKYGVTWYHVKNIRMKAGLFPLQQQKKKATAEIEVVWPEGEEIEAGKVTPQTIDGSIDGGTRYDCIIEEIRDQILMFQNALSVLEGLRDLALAE